MPNINKPGACAVHCAQPSPLYLTARPGDVRRCEHGRIWYCYTNQSRLSWIASGYWRPLHPIFDWFKHRAAARALEEHQPPTIRNQPPPAPPLRPDATRKVWKD